MFVIVTENKTRKRIILPTSEILQIKPANNERSEAKSVIFIRSYPNNDEDNSIKGAFFTFVDESVEEIAAALYDERYLADPTKMKGH